VDGVLNPMVSISQHHYSGSFCTGSGAALQDLMTKSYIRGNLSAFIPDIEATLANGLKYILGETNSKLLFDNCSTALDLITCS
jgi:hypothetical protein